jgi:hypothetical protein
VGTARSWDVSKDLTQSVLCGNLRERRDHLEDTDVDGRVILKCIFKNCDRSTGLFNLGEDRGRWGGGSCECGNEPSVATQCVEFLD